MNKNRIDFLVIGAQKAGTTALFQYLKAHPSIEMGRQKELHFFDNEEHFSQTHTSYEVYHGAFPPLQYGKLFGEATPIYLYWEPALPRIWTYNPNIKLIACLRNPITRAYSHWNMEYKRSWDSLTFPEALKWEWERSREALQLQHRVFSYQSRGFYSEQIRRWRRFFPDEQLLFINYDQFRKKPQECLSRVATFLDIPNHWETLEKEYNKLKYDHPISLREFAYLYKIFANDIREVERLLKWDCSSWLDFDRLV